MKKILFEVFALVTTLTAVPAAPACEFTFGNGHSQIASGDLNIQSMGVLTGEPIHLQAGTSTQFGYNSGPMSGSYSNLYGNLYLRRSGRSYDLSNPDLRILGDFENNWSANLDSSDEFNRLGHSPSSSPSLLSEPASLLLLGSGVLMLAVLAKMKLA